MALQMDGRWPMAQVRQLQASRWQVCHHRAAQAAADLRRRTWRAATCGPPCSRRVLRDRAAVALPAAVPGRRSSTASPMGTRYQRTQVQVVERSFKTFASLDLMHRNGQQALVLVDDA